jgi:hypothetical protein
MYPTVCALMGLWEFVRANGISHCDDTEEVRNLVESPPETLVERLRNKEAGGISLPSFRCCPIATFS